MTDRKEYIERGALMAQIKATPWQDYIGTWHGCGLHRDINEIVESQPAADVAEVVRCEKCVHFRITETPTGTIMGCVRLGFSPCKPDDYCSHGERKDGAE